MIDDRELVQVRDGDGRLVPFTVSGPIEFSWSHLGEPTKEKPMTDLDHLHHAIRVIEAYLAADSTLLDGHHADLEAAREFVRRFYEGLNGGCE